MQKNIALVFSLFLITMSTTLAAVVSVEVEAYGEGVNFQDAVSQALIAAIGQVKGQSIAANSQLNTIATSVTTEESEVYFSSDEYKSKVYSATNGVVSGYRILDRSKRKNDTWEVSLLVNIAKYQHKLPLRKRIAVLPLYVTTPSFSIAGKRVSATSISRQLNQYIVDYLVQSRKFILLDRDYVQQTAGELGILVSGQVPMLDLARLGETLVADYVLVGMIDHLEADIKRQKTRLHKGEASIASAMANIHYRLIDISTQQIVISDNYNNRVTGRKLKNTEGLLTTHSLVNGLVDSVSREIVKKILSYIYPVLVVSVSGKKVILGQGGKGLEKGEYYSVYKYGKKIYDPYTKEFLGREEEYCCQVVVTRVLPKQAYAEIVSDDMNIYQQFQPKTFVLRERVIRKEKREILTERIKKRREKHRKKLNNNDGW